MKKIKMILFCFLAVTLTFLVVMGCSGQKDFTYSQGIDQNGFWKGIKALEHVELGKYEGISVPPEFHVISDQSVQDEIDTILAYYAAEEQVTDRAIADGDTVNIDYVGSINGAAFEGGNTGGMGTNVTIGVTEYIDDFLKQLIGHKPGETFDVKVTFPQDYGQEELNGQDAVFEVTVNYIAEMSNPELDDDFVAENLSPTYGWNSIDEMEQSIRDDLQKTAVSYYVQDYIVDNSTINSLPDSLVEYQEGSLIYYYQNYAEYYGVELQEFLETYLGVASTDQLLEDNKENNKENAEFFLIIQAIAEDAGISVNDEDVDKYFTEFWETDGYAEFEETYGMPYLKLTTLHQKVLDYVADKAVLE